MDVFSLFVAAVVFAISLQFMLAVVAIASVAFAAGPMGLGWAASHMVARILPARP